jgi:predicted DNA-binding antitoxin AbrB/MazE fold protein
MTRSVSAIFEGGAFKPTVPLALPEGTHVELVVITEASIKPAGGQAAAILAEIAKLSTTSGDPATSEKHDDVLYGAEGCR